MAAPPNYVSVPRRPPDIEDYIDILRRHRSWIIAPMFMGLVISVVVGCLRPDTYISRATLRIIPQQVPERLVPSAISMQLAVRMQQMQADILSTQSLTDIIENPKLDLYKSERRRLPMEDITQDMRNKGIRIEPIRETALPGQRYASAFTVQFSYQDRYKAQGVVRELVTKFTEQNVNVQRRQATVTTNFLNEEVRSAKERMDAATAALAKFKAENQGRLPDQETANAQALSVLQVQLMNAAQNLSRAQQDKSMIEAQIENNRQQQRAEEADLEQVIPGSSPAAARNEALFSLQKAIGEATARLADLRQAFGAGHPDVAKQQGIVDTLERQRLALETAELTRPAQQPQGGAPRRVTNPQVQRRLDELKAAQNVLQVSLDSRQGDLEAYMKQQASLEREIDKYRRRIEESPMTTQQYSTLLSDLSLAKQQYEDMQRKHALSETAKNLEDMSAGEVLEVLEPASLPVTPSEPNRILWAAFGTIGGLGFGVALAAVKEVKDTSLKNLKDVRAYTNLPVLSSVPLLENALLVRRKRRLGWVAWSCGIMLGFAMMGTAIFYRYSNL